MDEQMVGFAGRAMISKRWRWLPGMLVVNVDGPIRIDGGDSEPFVYGRCQWSGDRIELCVREFPLPDFSDAGSRGCLLELIRLAYGDHEIYVGLLNFGKPQWVVRKANVGGGIAIIGIGDNEVDALVDALEQAP